MFSTAADNQTSVEVHVLQGEREMAKDNRTLGNFHLVGIPPAPRGMPQIEVTFDIDANGIVSVSAKDLGTGKEQSIRIEADSGLSEDDIEKMVADAESHASEDAERRKSVDARNKLDSMVYATEKSLEEHKDKLDAGDISAIESALENAKKALEGDDVEAIENAEKALMEASHKLAEQMYQAQGAPGAEAPDGAEGAAAGSDDDVIDAEYVDVESSEKGN